jgi:hypothetical protein
MDQVEQNLIEREVTRANGKCGPKLEQANPVTRRAELDDGLLPVRLIEITDGLQKV